MGQGKSGRAPWLLGLGFLLLYLKTLCPTVYLGDSGEIATAIATGGVVHPPGYPLFSLLGRAALFLVPFGEPAFRIGCVVALAAALAVVILFHLARELGASVPASLLAAAAFGTSYTFWSQSTRVEVYSLHVLLASCALLGALRYRRTGAASWLWACAGAVTLGLAHHLTIVLLGPALLILCGKRLWTDPQPLRRWLPALALVPVGPALYLLLMLWARAEPLQNWGRPVTLDLLWNHATAKIYRGYLELPFNAELGEKVGMAAGLFVDNFPYGLFLLPLAGIVLLLRQNRTHALGLLAAAGVITFYNFCYTIPDIAGYYMTVWLILGAFAAPALDALRPRLEQYARPAVLGAIGAALLLGMPLVRNGSNCDLSGATWVRDFARHKLQSADPDTVLITQGDNDTGPIQYVHDLLGERPDITPIDRGVIAGMYTGRDKDPSRWYLYRLQRQGVPISTEIPADPQRVAYLGGDGALIDLVSGPLKERPLAITFAATSGPKEKDSGYFLEWLDERSILLPVGIIMRIHPKGKPVDLPGLINRNVELWGKWELPPAQPVRTDQEIDRDYLWKHYASMLENFAHLYELQNDTEGAAAVQKILREQYPRYGR